MSLSSNSNASGDWRVRFGALCDQLVHPSVSTVEERGRHRRFLGVALAAPFLLGAALVQVVAPAAGIAIAVAAICLVFVVAWSAAVAVAQTGVRSIAAPVMLAAAAVPVALVVHHAGGAQSALFLAWLPFLIEPWFVLRSRVAVAAGAVAIVGGLAFWAALALGGAGADAAVPPGWHWLVPIAYGATLWLRRDSFLRVEVPSPALARGIEIEELLPAVALRFSADGQVIDASARARVLLGVAPEFLLGGGLGDRIHVSDRIVYLSALADMRAGMAGRAVELRLRVPSEATAAGSSYAAFALDLVASPDGTTFAGFLRDNGEVARLREEVAEAGERAEAGRKRFLASVSHELRTPLNAIIGFSDMLLHEMMGPFANERQRDYVGLVRESGQHLLGVVNSVLDMSRIEAGTYPILPSRFAFEDALSTSRAIVGYQAKAKGIVIESEHQSPVGEIVADRRAVQQILINLLSNAVKFTPKGGGVVTGARCEAGRLVFWVSDTGIGIAPDDLPRIGQPFVQLINDDTRHYEGTGLGLSLVKRLVELQKGSMTIESAPGMGTTVTIAMPVAESKTTSECHAEIRTVPSPKEQKEYAHEALRKSA